VVVVGVGVAVWKRKGTRAARDVEDAGLVVDVDFDVGAT
jgi:hypothetical protein